MTTSHNLIDYGGPFIGRAEELTAIDGAVRDGARLLTLFGPAGVGKTRLAVHYALTRGVRHAQRTDAPTYFCDLSSARTADDLLGAVMRAFGISAEASGRGDPAALVRNWIAARGRMLFILDNFEQVAEAGAAVVARWSAQCPAAVFLVTSRHRLAVPGETVVPVEPLGLPPADGSPAAVAGSEAVRLLLSRVGAALPDPQNLPPEHARMLADVVRRLEGIPLAIELAAARLELMTLPALRERLRARFELLRDPSRTPEDRHATLQAAIDGSWELLKPWERAVLCQASVFEGGFTLEAAEAVIRLSLSGEAGEAGEPGEGRVAPSVLDGIHGLCRKSLLRSHRPGEPDYEPRFSMFASVREYAAAKFATQVGRAEAVVRFQDYVLGAAEKWCEQVDGRDGPEALGRLLAEHENLGAVLRDALAVEPPTESCAVRALRAATAMSPGLSMRGPVRTLVAALDGALAAAERVADAAGSAHAARALLARGTAQRYAGNLDAALADLSRCRETAERCGDESLAAQAVRMTAVVMYLRGRLPEARALAERALEAFVRVGDGRREGEALSALGLIVLDEGEFARAREVLERALAVLRRGGHLRFQGYVYSYLGTVCSEQSDLPRAREYYESALTVHRRFGSQRAEGSALGSLGIVRHLSNDLSGAAESYAHALAIAREVGDARLEAYYLYYSAMLALERGGVGLDAAGQDLERALELLRSVGDPRYEAIVLSALAAHRALADRAEEFGDALAAARTALTTASDAHLARLGDAVEALAGAHAGRPGARARARELSQSLSAVPSDDARLMLRVLAAELLRHEEVERTWSFGPGALWFRVPGGETVSLESRAVPARLLDALLAERLREPGRALTLEALVGAGWPGARVMKSAAVNRVHVALSTLRKAGLEPLILRTREGYLLDPAVPVRREG